MSFYPPLNACEKFLYQQIGIDSSSVLDTELLQTLQENSKKTETNSNFNPIGPPIDASPPRKKKDYPKAVFEQDCENLGDNALRHIKNYVSKLYQNEDVSGYAKSTSLERLTMEITHFVANWRPDKSFKSPRDKRLFQLSVAGAKLCTGKWTIPPAYLEADRAEIKLNLEMEMERPDGFGLH